MSHLPVDQFLADLAEELTDSSHHVERVPRTRTEDHKYRTFRPGLLTQLHRVAVDPSKAQDESGSARPKPESKPPLALEALSCWLDIVAGVSRWCDTLALTRGPSVESNIRALVTLSAQLDSDTIDALRQDMKTWRRWAAVMTGWETKVFIPAIPCPVCTTFRSIRVNPQAWLGFCTECQHSWSEGDLICVAENAKREAA